jgi:predicted transcriptional regulator
MRTPKNYLTKREQEIMEILFRDGKATANELMSKLSGNPSNSSVRTQLRILENKGLVIHEVASGQFLFTPIDAREDAGENALASVVKTFFSGSITQTVASLLTQGESKLTQYELSELENLIARAKEEGR